MSMNFSQYRRLLVCFPLVVAIFWPAGVFARYLELDAVADVKTQFSDGCSTVRELANIAKHRKIDVVIYSDHDNNSLEYGVWPLERVFKKKDEQTAVLSEGVESYLAEIQEGGKSLKETVMIPAIESAPFYYWTGNFFDKQPTVNGWDKHLLIVGLQTAENFEELPILNGGFSTRYTTQKLNNFLLYLIIFIACLVFVRKKVFRIVTIPLSFFSLLLVYNHHPFPSSPFDPYHGDRGIKPYQDVIDYAVAKGAMVFWNHIESSTGAGKSDLAKINTSPHPEDLVLSENYTGFEAVSDEPVRATDPGKEWDHVLTKYIQGDRKAPVWGYGGNDFHCEGQDNHVLGGARTVLLATEKTPNAALEAMFYGRMYSVRQPAEGNRLSLAHFAVADGVSGKEAISGEEIATLNAPEIKVRIRSTKQDERTVKVSIIRNGELVREEKGTMPYEFTWQDTDVVRQGRAYYRIKAEVGPTNYLLSNPIFVRFSGLALQVASVPPAKAPPIVPEFKISGPQSPEAPTASEPVEPTVAMPKPTQEPVEKQIASPKPPAVSEPHRPEIEGMNIENPDPMETEETKPQFVTPLVDAVALKKSPDASSPQIATVNKGDKLALVGRTTILYNDKPWLIVKKGNLTAFVWEPLVKVE